MINFFALLSKYLSACCIKIISPIVNIRFDINCHQIISKSKIELFIGNLKGVDVVKCFIYWPYCNKFDEYHVNFDDSIQLYTHKIIITKNDTHFNYALDNLEEIGLILCTGKNNPIKHKIVVLPNPKESILFIQWQILRCYLGLLSLLKKQEQKNFK